MGEKKYVHRHPAQTMNIYNLLGWCKRKHGLKGETAKMAVPVHQPNNAKKQSSSVQSCEQVCRRSSPGPTETGPFDKHLPGASMSPAHENQHSTVGVRLTISDPSHTWNEGDKDVKPVKTKQLER